MVWITGDAVYKEVISVDLTNMTAKEVHDLIRKHTRSIGDDEWLEICDWLDGFLKSSPPPEEAKLFVPLGCGEMVWIICDGILRWRNSICINCRKQQGYDKYCCSVYQRNEKYLGGIPNQVWANENAECHYYEE